MSYPIYVSKPKTVLIAKLSEPSYIHMVTVTIYLTNVIADTLFWQAHLTTKGALIVYKIG